MRFTNKFNMTFLDLENRAQNVKNTYPKTSHEMRMFLDLGTCHINVNCNKHTKN